MPTASDLNRNRLIVLLNHAARRLIAGCLVLAATTVAASPAQAAEDRTAAVEGRVLDPLGGAIAHATVTLVRDDHPVTAATSDESGRFALASRESGRYRVHVEAPGFGPRDTNPVFVAVGDRVTVDVTLAIFGPDGKVVHATPKIYPIGEESFLNLHSFDPSQNNFVVNTDIGQYPNPLP